MADGIISKRAANLFTVEYRVNYYQVMQNPDGKYVVWIESPVWSMVQPGTKMYKEIVSLMKAAQ